MTDCDGCFHIGLSGLYAINPSPKKGRIICSFALVQRMIDKSSNMSCIPFMEKIAKLFQCNLIFRTPDNAISFIAQANAKHYLVKSYFDKFPLMSSKHLDYLS